MSTTHTTPMEQAMHDTALITKDMTVGDVVRKYPQVAPIFQSYGLHCVGCGVQYFETIEQGAMGHGMNEETFANMLKDANTVAAERAAEPTVEIVTLTAKAVKKVQEFMNGQQGKAPCLRIGILKGGCAGLSYDLALEDAPKLNDTIIKQDAITIVISNDVVSQVKGTRIDYVDALQGSGFKIDNPNAKSSCGCGNSFS